ncbi:MAG: AAA family ATPase [Planctomycetales bacterium]|nr:AAA family ATPase [Planctomycetales bacterium]
MSHYTPTVDRNEVERALNLLVEGGEIFEIRTVGDQKLSGLFNSVADAVNAVAALDLAQVSGVYVTLNPVLRSKFEDNPSRQNRLSNGTAVRDVDIDRRRWLFVDLDAQRPSGTSASEVEKEAARRRAEAIVRVLRDDFSAADEDGSLQPVEAWPEPLIADSGNGYHLLYPIDLPNDDESLGIVQGFLRRLNSELGDDAVKIDTAVSNAARIIKLYGTPAMKGDSTPDRPHRPSRLVAAPDSFTPAPRTLLANYAAGFAPSPCAGGQAGEVRRPDGPGVGPESYRTYCRFVENFPEAVGGSGTGNKNTLAAAHAIVRFAEIDGVSDDQCWRLVQHYNRTRCTPEWDETATRGPDSLRRVYDAALRRGGYSPIPEFFGGLDVERAERQLSDAVQRKEDAGPQRDRLKYGGFTVAELEAMDLSIKYLVEDLLIDSQPMVIAGPSKSLKTSLALGLGLSLATGTPFAGREVREKKKVLMLSGESGLPNLRATLRRIAASRDLNATACEDRLRLEPTVPSFSSKRNLLDLRATLEALRPEVLIIDPAYLAFGGEGSENVFAMGEKFADLRSVCRAAECVPIILHHVKKASAAKRELELTDLAWAGWSEFAGQWWLISPQAPFDGRHHNLRIKAGSRAGSFASLGLRVEEGRARHGEPLDTRLWREEWIDYTAAEGIDLFREDTLEADVRRVLAILEQADEPLSENGIRTFQEKNMRGEKVLRDEPLRDALQTAELQGKIEVKHGRTTTYAVSAGVPNSSH